MALTLEKLLLVDLFEKNEASKVDRLLELFRLFSQLNSVDQFIKDAPAFPGSTEKISRNEMVQAIGSTLAIEGTVMDKAEIEESIKKAELSMTLQRKEQEAENSRRVYHFTIETVENAKAKGEKFIYSEAIIRQIHYLFTDNLNYLSNVPGEYRSNFVSTFGEPRREGLCRTQDEIQNAMKNLVIWLNKDDGNSLLKTIPIIKAIMAHYYLSEIHPFGDGNGRTARALEALILYVNGINSYCFWSLANFWSANKNEYLAHLRSIKENCNPWDFVLWGLDGFLQEVTRIKSLVLRKLKQLMLMDYTRYLFRTKQLQEIKINERIVNLMEFLLKVGAMPLAKFNNLPQIKAFYSDVIKLTYQRDLKKMEKLGLIKLEQLDAPVDKTVFICPNFQKLDHLEYYLDY